MKIKKIERKNEIGLCNLMAICAGRVRPSNYAQAAYYALKIVDNVIDIMEYPFASLETTARARRSAGIGITNLAYDMAQRGLKYDSQAGKDYMHRLAEMHSYWLHEASLEIAKEKGNAPWIHKTKYPEGWLPIDTYCKHVDNITDQKLQFNWEDLRNRIIANGGIRNSVLEAFMPCESSSVASNTSNGLYPIRNSVVIKTDGDSKKVFIAPDWDNLKDAYQFAYDIPTKDIIEMYAIFQKFCGQTISADVYHRYAEDGSDRKIGSKQLLQEFLYRHKCGMKSRYYVNSASGVSTNNSNNDEGACASGACKM